MIFFSTILHIGHRDWKKALSHSNFKSTSGVASKAQTASSQPGANIYTSAKEILCYPFASATKLGETAIIKNMKDSVNVIMSEWTN